MPRCYRSTSEHLAPGVLTTSRFGIYAPPPRLQLTPFHHPHPKNDRQKNLSGTLLGNFGAKSPLWFEYAFRLSFLRAYVGKWDAYHELCAQALEGYSGSTDPVVLERTAKMCLFSNRSKTDTQAAAELADRAEGQVVTEFSIYTRLTQGIADLRRKAYEQALESLNAVVQRGVLQDNIGNDITVALAKMYASIACHHLGRPAEAQRYYDESALTIRTFPRGTGWWPDWMMAVIVMKEAEDWIAQGEKKSP